jgi:hypothetical protein
MKNKINDINEELVNLKVAAEKLKLQRSLVDDKERKKMNRAANKIKHSKKERLALEKKILKLKIKTKELEIKRDYNEIKNQYSLANVATDFAMQFVDGLDEQHLTEEEQTYAKKYRQRRSLAWSRITDLFVNLFLVAEARATNAAEKMLPNEKETNNETYVIGKDDVE